MSLVRLALIFSISFTLISCSSPRFKFLSWEIYLENFSEEKASHDQIELVWFAQRKSFLGTYIQEVVRQLVSSKNGNWTIPSITLPYSEVMVGIFLKNKDSHPLGFFSDTIKKDGILPLSLLKSGVKLKIEEIGGIEGKIFLNAEKKAEDIGLEIRVSDSMNPPAEVIWWFPLERDKYNRIFLERNFFPYFSFPQKLFKVSIKIKFCRTRYKMRIMEERKIFEKDLISLSEADEVMKNELREIKYNLKI